MKIKSALLTQMSGSIGGMTGAHNNGGLYLRARAIPTDPQSQRQIEVRNMMTMYSQMWLNTLTAAQRAAWELYAENVLVTDRLGSAIQISGQNHFLRANVGRSAAATRTGVTATLASIIAAPTEFDLPMFVPPSLDTFENGSQIKFAFDDTAAWINNATNAILVYMGRPRNATRNYFKGPYRYAGMIQGDATTPPASPSIIAGLGGANPTPEDIWPEAPTGAGCKLKFVLSIGFAGNQPTGLSAASYLDTIIG